jgi:hypothetical protein
MDAFELSKDFNQIVHYKSMKIENDEPTVVFLIGFSSVQEIDNHIPGLLNGLTKINTSSIMQDIRDGSRFLLYPTGDELLHIAHNAPCIHLVSCARTIHKQVFVVLDTIKCMVPSFRCAASHIICSPSTCQDLFACGVWMDIDSCKLEFI